MFSYGLGLDSEFFPSHNPSIEVAETQVWSEATGQTPGAIPLPTETHTCEPERRWAISPGCPRELRTSLGLYVHPFSIFM